jgi:hypothetical protein
VCVRVCVCVCRCVMCRIYMMCEYTPSMSCRSSSQLLSGASDASPGALKRAVGDSSGLLYMSSKRSNENKHCCVCNKKLGWKKNGFGWRFKHVCHLCHR